MRLRSTLMLFACVLVLAGAAAGRADQGTSGRRLEMEQTLRQRYMLTEIGPGILGLTGGTDTIREAGGVLVVQRAGLYGSLDRTQAAALAVREDSAEVFRGRKDFAFPVGERLYVHSVYVGRDVIVLGLLSARLVTTPGGTGRLWASASFFFPEETLARADAGAVFRVLDQWLLPEGQRAVAAEPAPEPPPPPPTDLQPGMTRDEVVAVLGAPRREVSFGTRTWLTYPALVVLLEDGKLSSVDRSGQPPAKVSVRSDPEGADVYLDGIFVSSTPATLELPAGTYKVSVRLPGYQEWQRDLRVLAGSDITLNARLTK